MLLNGAVDGLEHALLFLITFGRCAQHVQRAPIALVVFPNAAGQLFL